MLNSLKEKNDSVINEKEKYIGELVANNKELRYLNSKNELILEELDHEYRLIVKAMQDYYIPMSTQYLSIINSRWYKYILFLKKIKRKLLRR